MRLVALSLVAFVVVISIAGCANGGVGLCESASDCAPGQVCSAGECAAPSATIDGGTGRRDGAPNVRDGCVPSAEWCNGDDDDCDGVADDGTALCPVARGTGECSDGRCRVATCATGFADCDLAIENGCETSLGAASSCGACGRRCEGATAVCAPSASGAACAATCPAGSATLCGGACVDTATDLLHCGACDRPCARDHAATRCIAGACMLGACDPGWGDCDGDPATGCETSLATTSDCGSCDRACTAPTGCSSGASCVEGECAYGPATAATVCRAAVDVCDAVETCGGALSCGADVLAPAGTTCRAPACAGDLAEACTGSAAACPPACGCSAEACCAGSACATGLACRGGVCRSCSTAVVGVAGSWTVPCDESCSRLVSVTGTAAGLEFRSSDSSIGTIALGTGITASGTYTIPCEDESGCARIMTIRGEGDRITFYDARGGSGSIGLAGATASGEASFPCDDSCTTLRSVWGGGDRLSFPGAGDIVITGVETCL
jgi:hypothetical protein